MDKSEECYSAEKKDRLNIDVEHPETIIAVLINLKGSKYKLVRELMDFCTTNSLTAEELLGTNLIKYMVQEDNITS